MEGGKWVNDDDDEYFASGYHFSLARHAADVGGDEISLRIGNKGCWRTGYGRLGSTVYGLPRLGRRRRTDWDWHGDMGDQKDGWIGIYR